MRPIYIISMALLVLEGGSVAVPFKSAAIERLDGRKVSEPVILWKRQDDEPGRPWKRDEDEPGSPWKRFDDDEPGEKW